MRKIFMKLDLKPFKNISTSNETEEKYQRIKGILFSISKIRKRIATK